MSGRARAHPVENVMPLWLFLTLPLAGMVASLGLRLVLAAAPLPFWPRVVAGTLGVALALAGGGEIVVGALLVRRYVRAEVGRGR